MPEKNLHRFIEAQQMSYDIALAEITAGKKRSHWMWYIFPQIAGLGISETSVYYGIQGLQEAGAFLQHPLLGSRLIAICTVLYQLNTVDARKIFGSPDDSKLRSCMTLFAMVPGAHPVFQMVLGKFFGGIKDNKTLHIIQTQIR